MKTMHKFLAVVISAALAAGLLAGCGAASGTGIQLPPLLRPCPLWQLPVKPLPLRLLPGRPRMPRSRQNLP